MAKPAPKTPTRSRTRTRTGPATGRMWLAGAALAALVVTGVLLVNRGDDSGGGGAEIGHVHGLGINPADGQLYAAAHNGVFRLPDGGEAARVGDGAQDTMGFTIVGPDRFLASGHPGPFENGPDHLGLIESTDAGVSWQVRSLAGEADLHALRHRHDTVYGYNAVTGRFMASPDGTRWQDRSGIELADFAVSPTDPDLVLATTRDGLARSVDGGRSWTPAGGPPVLLLAWDTDDRLWGINPAGRLLRSTDGGTSWSTAGTVPGVPSAFAAYGDDLYLAVPDDGVFGSHDGGNTWDQRYP